MVVPEALLIFAAIFQDLRYCRGWFNLTGRFNTEDSTLRSALSSRVRFGSIRKPIRPNHHLTLNIKYVRSRNCIYFDYADAEGACSSGQIGFAPK